MPSQEAIFVPYRPKTGQTWFDCNVRHVSSTHLVDVSTIWIPRTRLHSLEMRVIRTSFPASCVNPIAAQPLCQTQLLAMNLQQAPKVAEAILQMFGGPRPGKGGNPGAYHSAEVLEKALYKSMITQFEASQGVFCEDFISLVCQFIARTDFPSLLVLCPFALGKIVFLLPWFFSFDRNMFTHYDRAYIGQLCEKAGLMQWVRISGWHWHQTLLLINKRTENNSTCSSKVFRASFIPLQTSLQNGWRQVVELGRTAGSWAKLPPKAMEHYTDGTDLKRVMSLPYSHCFPV